MNSFPSWIHRIPEMIEILALADVEHVDRQLAERLLDLRRTAAKALLHRLGGALCGHSLVISRHHPLFWFRVKPDRSAPICVRHVPWL